MRWAMRAGWASPATASSSVTRTASARSTPSTFSRSARSGEAAPGAGRRDPGHGAGQTRASMTVSCARSCTPRRGGQDRQIMVRNGGTQSIGRQMVYDIDLGHVPGEVGERRLRLRRAVARVLPVARPGQPESNTGLHDDLDPGGARSQPSGPAGGGPVRHGVTDETTGEILRAAAHRRDFHPAGSRRAADSTRSPTPRACIRTAASSTTRSTRTSRADPAIQQPRSRTSCTRSRSPTTASAATWRARPRASTCSTPRPSRITRTRTWRPARPAATCIRPS